MSEKEQALIEALNIEHYDFNKAKKLISESVDVNARVESDEAYENVLSMIIDNFRYHAGCILKPISGCSACPKYDNCLEAEHIEKVKVGVEIREIIRLFLQNGYDLSFDEGKAGVVLLERLIYTTFDKEEFYTAKELLLAGIENSVRTTEDEETILDYFTDESYMAWFAGENWYLSILYETLCQIIESREAGLSYKGIDLYEKAIGKTIKQIYISGKASSRPVIQVYENESIEFTDKIIIEFEDGYLVIDNYAYAWTNNEIPYKQMLNVSEHAEKFIGRQIKDITVDLEKALRIDIELDSGKKVTVESTTDINKERVGKIWCQKC